MKNFEELNDLVIQWADDKGILSKATSLAQIDKTIEEVLETREALFASSCGLKDYVNKKGINVDTEDEVVDGFGDVLVTVLIGCKLKGIDPLDALKKAYDVISKRSGKMINGVFVKDK